ncbi:MAG: pilus assembly protein [Holosporaceae bacterium]|jgi:hypothetical protein|nr:pilus assembly protein [Holosporaceae bacterium]
MSITNFRTISVKFMKILAFIGKILRKVNGSVLIEFALTAPVLLTILYFAMDVPKHARECEKMRFSTYCAINMIQNLTQKRDDRRITRLDMAYIFSTSMISFFGGGGNIQYGTSNEHPLGYWPSSRLYYIKGVGDNKAKIIWKLQSTGPLSAPGDPMPEFSTVADEATTVKGNFNSEIDSSAILPDLTIRDGEVKMIYEVSLCTKSNITNPRGGIWWTGDEPPRSFWGFYLLKPTRTFYDDSSSPRVHAYFTRATVFTPSPGLFVEDPPE